MKRTIPLPKYDPDTVAVRLRRHGDKAITHMRRLMSPIRIEHYPMDYTIRRLIYRGLVLVIPYFGVDFLVNAAATNVAMRAGGYV